jgi:nucleotide-binding universal stress UspA family protein
MCVSAEAGDFSAQFVVKQLFLLAIFALVVLFGLDWLGKQYFRHNGDHEGNQFLFVLAAVFLSAIASELVNIEAIVGAFLAGLAVNDVVGNGPVKEKVEFVGGVLFIPFFFICMGLLLDVGILVESLTTNLGFTLALSTSLIASKFLAALVVKPLHGYSWNQTLTMWSLSLPQVAATLAAAVVGLQAGIITELDLNAVIVMMLVTSVLGPILTARFAGRLMAPRVSPPQSNSLWFDSPPSGNVKLEQGLEVGDRPADQGFTVVVPIYNPVTQRYLIEMAALLANHEGGRVVPVVITRAQVHMDEPELLSSIQQGRRFLHKAMQLSREFNAPATSILRIDDDVPAGICRTAREQDASLIIMGWSRRGLRARLFGTLIDDVFWSSHCPVAVTRLLAEPIDIHRILLPMKILTPQSIRTARFAQIFANTHAAAVTLLHVCDPFAPGDQVQGFEAELKQLMDNGPQISWDLLTIASDDPAQVILDTAQQYDMVVLRSVRRRTVGGLTVSDVTHRVIDEATCSLVLFGEPHS